MITVVGDALIDIIADQSGSVTSVVGGGGLNTARALGRLGVEVEFLGGVSEDSFGGRIRRLLDDDAVSYALGEPVDAPTTLAIAQLDAHGSASYRFLLHGTSVAAVTPEMAVAHVTPGTSVIHVGTLGLTLRPIADAMVAVVQNADDGCIVMIDPNCRPTVMDDPSCFNETVAAILPRADIVKVSAEDLEFMHPGMDMLDAAIAVQRESGAVVLLTDGAKAVHVITADEDVVLEVPKVTVVDTVGAGDSFSAGFLSQWMRRGLSRADLADLDEVLSAARFGISVAGIVCQRPGADPPTIQEIEVR
mgnify:FL=1